MAPFTLFISFLLTNLAVLHSAQEERNYTRCEPYFCNDHIGNISFPFKYWEQPAECGLFSVDCPKELPPISPMIQLIKGGHWHEFTTVSNDTVSNVSVIINQELRQRLQSNPCDEILGDLSLPRLSPILYVSITYDQILLICSNSLDTNGWNLIAPNFISLQVNVSAECYECISRGDIYQVHEGETEPTCLPAGENLKLKLGLGLGLGIGLGVPTLLAACFFILWSYRKKGASLNLVSSRNTPNSDIEGRSVYLSVPVFTYKELEEATNHFDCEKEIGDGGYGIVYHGKLKDGREVAVKRLYEHNYRRAEQFMNEIEILTHLRHKNLVTLYGCTSRHSRDLLLVYEYISNGTVADHLHGDRAATRSLTWPIRMSIARETASALFYLYASDIVHRDVKTTNILLDNNFTVKVADFGISRLFPLDATHVSTAPQGTPGYVDPEYHKCYQLTPKSDVYSFGVVLIELISSLPAVDITRHREEINLSYLAINRIQNGLYGELVDSCLGFESDDEVKRMIIAVADLAFQCLQQDSDARPTMSEVFEALKKIESRNDVPKNINTAFCDAGMPKSMRPSPSPYSDRSEMLKNMKAQSSPNSVIGKWTSSSSTTSNVSA